jgi:arsenite methyltransferase
MVVITSEQRDVIFDAVRAMYTAVADRPEQEYHFPTGKTALEYVGYPAEQLGKLPESALESFAGVGYPFAADVLRPGDTVLDIGSGSGTDLLIAALLVGPNGHAIGMDMTAAMREKCLANAHSIDLAGVAVLDARGGEVRALSGLALTNTFTFFTPPPSGVHCDRPLPPAGVPTSSPSHNIIERLATKSTRRPYAS